MLNKWYLCLFQLVRCNGKVLLSYKDNLLEVLGHVLKLKCVHGYELAGQLLRFTLRALTLEYVLNFQSVAGSYDRPVSEYVAIRVSGFHICSHVHRQIK